MLPIISSEISKIITDIIGNLPVKEGNLNEWKKLVKGIEILNRKVR